MVARSGFTIFWFLRGRGDGGQVGVIKNRPIFLPQVLGTL